MSQIDFTVVSWEWSQHPVWRRLDWRPPYFNAAPPKIQYFLQKQIWGPGIFQSRINVKHILEIESDLAHTVLKRSVPTMGAERHKLVLQILARNDAHRDTEKIPDWIPPCWFDFKKAYVLWSMYAMERGIILDKDVLQKIRADARGFPSLHAQLQIITALESVSIFGTMDLLQLGDWPSGSIGLGRSEDENAYPSYPHMQSKSCMRCGRQDLTKTCHICGVARYCDNDCREKDWPLYTHVCSEDVLVVEPLDVVSADHRGQANAMPGAFST